MSIQHYQIAGHPFRLSLPQSTLGIDSLSNYLPFLVDGEKGNCLFQLTIVDDLPATDNYEPIGQFDDDIASIGVYKSSEGCFRFRIGHPASKDYCTLDVDACFKEAKVQLPNDEQHGFFCLNNCLMLLYAFSTSNLDTLLIHASVITNNSKGFIFLGKSGTGKSTHSRLWLEHIAGCELLNDDNPVIRIIDGEAGVFGTPWSGKTHCYKNDSAPLKAIVKLRQSPENQIKRLSSLLAYAAVLPSCSSMQWEANIATGIHLTVEKLATTVGCYQLDCLPDKAAAEICHKTVNE